MIKIWDESKLGNFNPNLIYFKFRTHGFKELTLSETPCRSCTWIRTVKQPGEWSCTVGCITKHFAFYNYLQWPFFSLDLWLCSFGLTKYKFNVLFTIRLPQIRYKLKIGKCSYRLIDPDLHRVLRSFCSLEQPFWRFPGPNFTEQYVLRTSRKVRKRSKLAVTPFCWIFSSEEKRHHLWIN